MGRETDGKWIKFHQSITIKILAVFITMLVNLSLYIECYTQDIIFLLIKVHIISRPLNHPSRSEFKISICSLHFIEIPVLFEIV